MRIPDPVFRIPTMDPRSFHGGRKPGTGTVRNPFSPATLLLVLLPLSWGCAPASPSAEQEIFWNRLQDLCGQAFEGRVLEAPPEDGWWEAERFVMHVRLCGPEEIRIPLHVDDDRSRTWLVTRTEEGLRLKHDHRLEDGMPDAANTDYGGDTLLPGSVWRQEFPADESSVEAVPARVSQLWYLEIRPEETFVYGLRREETGLRYRVEFDLTRPVGTPPPPWGG
jgi:hypothetical protein